MMPKGRAKWTKRASRASVCLIVMQCNTLSWASAQEQVTACSGFTALEQGSWSWVNGELAFTGDCQGNYALYLYDFESDSIERVDAGDMTPQWPTWSYSGDRIAFTAVDREGLRDIYILKTKSGEVTRLTHGGAHGGRMSWSPDDQWLAYYGPTDGQWDIYKIRTDGTGQKRLNPERYANYFNATFSPKGGSFLYSANMRIWMVTVDPNNPKMMTPEGISAVMPQWSPDGKSFAYDGHAGDNWELYLYDTESGSNRRLTNNLIMDWNASWAGDGERIAYLCQPGDYTTYCLLNIRTGEMRQLFRP